MNLLVSLASVAAILGVATLAGRGASAAFFPPGSAWRFERWGWSFVTGCAIVTLAATVALSFSRRPGWISFLLTAGIVIAASQAFRIREIGSDIAPERGRPSGRWLLGLLLALGVALYLLRAMTEPMWSNDYLAIWGLKGKTMVLAGVFPASVWPKGLYDFANLDYPLGLPLLYSGIAGLLGRWDDQALALLFPFFQAATLLVLFGWLRRHRLAWPIPLAAVALLSLWEPLYSAFLTGLAEIPLSCVFLLFGTAFSDCLDEADGGPEGSRRAGALRRLAFASLLAAAVKNEGIWLTAAAAVGAMFARAPTRRRVAAVAFLPATTVAVITRAASGGAPLRAFDFGFLLGRVSELPARLAEGLRTAAVEVALPAWPLLVGLALLLGAGRREASGDRLLALAVACLAVYLLLPALAAYGPVWLVRTTLSRTAAALAPLTIAGLAARLAPPGGGRREAKGESPR